MYKLYFLIGIAVAGATLDKDGWKGWTTAPKMPDIRRMLSNLERAESNSTCYRDFRRYVLSLGHEQWADQMIDSMEKVPYGLRYGRTVYLGSFDECIYADEGNFTGKHCMVDIIIGEPPLSLILLYGLCLPSTCTATDIQTALDDFGLEEFNVTVVASENNCWTSEPITLTTVDWIIICFLVFVGMLGVGSTAFDIMHRNNIITSNQYSLYSSFSLYSNTQQLVKIYNGADNVGCLHGIRSLTMCWIILCHEYVMGIFAPLLNGVAVVPDYMQSKHKIIINNGFVAVDTFFFLSGLLVTLVFFRNISKTGSYDVPVAMLHRFIRLTPAFAAMVLIHTIIVVKLGKGPMWHTVIGASVDTCKDSWWTGLLYVQNWVKPASSCLGQSWYLSSDMQMFWLSPLLLYPLLLLRMKGLIFVFLGLVAALTTNFVIALMYNLGPHLFSSRSFRAILKYCRERQFDTDYVQTHMRLTPYIVGMAMGYLICGIKGKKIRINLSKVWVTIGWLMSIGLCLGSMYGVIYFMENDYRDNYMLSSSYLTFHRLGWSLGLAWVVFACIAGYGGPVDYILSWCGFQILSKISYCMFLVHFSVQLVRLGMLQTNFYAHDFYFVSNYFSTLFFSVLFSVLLYLFFEAPFSNLDRYFLRNLKILPYPRREPAKELKETP